MNYSEIYLIDKEIHEITGPVFSLIHEQVANAATDKANKWWIKWLEPQLMKAAQELYCNADGWMIFLTREEWQALKKLAKGIDNQGK